MIEPYKIESKSEADSYLNHLLEKDEYRSMQTVEERAINLIPDEELRSYFISQAERILAV